jgi:hypothetical protein
MCVRDLLVAIEGLALRGRGEAIHPRALKRSCSKEAL